MDNYELKLQLLSDIYGEEALNRFLSQSGWKSFPFHTKRTWKRLGFRVKPNMSPLKLKQWFRIKPKYPDTVPHYITKQINVYLESQVDKIEGSH